MSLLFIDGFDHYAADETLKKWDLLKDDLTIDRISKGAGRFSGQSLQMDLQVAQNEFSAVTTSFSPNTEEVFVGSAFKFSDSVQEQIYIFIFYDSAGSRIAAVYMDSTGKLNIARDVDTSPTSLASSATALNDSAWYYIEARYIPLNTGGTFEVRINGTTEINFTGDTTNGLENVRNLGLGGDFTATSFYDDLYILDTSGTSNNTYLGDATVYTEVPTADTTEASFSPSSGTDHFAMVDDAADIDDDATYVENATLGATDRYTSGALGVTGTVHAVQISTTARKTDSASRAFKSSIKSGATEKEDGTEHFLNASYLVYIDIYEVDPNTSSAWTITNVDAMDFGFKITTAD